MKEQLIVNPGITFTYTYAYVYYVVPPASELSRLGQQGWALTNSCCVDILIRSHKLRGRKNIISGLKFISHIHKHIINMRMRTYIWTYLYSRMYSYINAHEYNYKYTHRYMKIKICNQIGVYVLCNCACILTNFIYAHNFLTIML